MPNFPIDNRNNQIFGNITPHYQNYDSVNEPNPLNMEANPEFFNQNRNFGGFNQNSNRIMPQMNMNYHNNMGNKGKYDNMRKFKGKTPVFSENKSKTYEEKSVNFEVLMKSLLLLESR